MTPSSDRALRIAQSARDAAAAACVPGVQVGVPQRFVQCGSNVAVLYEEQVYYGLIIRIGLLKHTGSIMDVTKPICLDSADDLPDSLCVWCAWYTEAPVEFWASSTPSRGPSVTLSSLVRAELLPDPPFPPPPTAYPEPCCTSLGCMHVVTLL